MSSLKPHSLTEKDLIYQCLQGDRNSQQMLFERYAGKMMTVCRRYARHDMEAEDMLQDGFIRVFTHLDKYSFQGSFEGWIRRIVINSSLKQVNKKSFKNEIVGSDYIPEKFEESITSKLSADELMSLVNELPDGYKLVFNLYAVEGYSHKEIGEMLGIQESTSRSQLVKARRILQKRVIELHKIAV